MLDKSHKSVGRLGMEHHKRKQKPKGVSDLVKMKELSVHELSVVSASSELHSFFLFLAFLSVSD